MSAPSHENLKTIRFEGELLPEWAQILDVAARLCPVSEQTRGWFSRFTRSTGVDDAQTVLHEIGTLKVALREHRDVLVAELTKTEQQHQAFNILAAWEYSLETMAQQASSKKTCSWQVEEWKGSRMVMERTSEVATLRFGESEHLGSGGV